MTCFSHQLKTGKKGTAADHAAYIGRTGKYGARQDLLFESFGNMPSGIDDPKDFWKACDRCERANGPAYKEHVVALSSMLRHSHLKETVNNLVEAFTPNKPFQLAVHSGSSSLEGVTNTHLHLMLSNRVDDGIERTLEQSFRRYNANRPELGGRRKDSGGRTPGELRDELIAMRKTCADIQNAVLAKYGYEDRVDHRTLKQQGINRKPESHLGQARIRKMSEEHKQAYVDARHAKSN